MVCSFVQQEDGGLTTMADKLASVVGDEGYFELMQRLEQHMNRVDVTLKYLRSQQHLCKSLDVNRCLSIGPGGGELDARMISEIFPQCKEYVGVDIDQRHLTSLESHMNRLCPTLKVQTVLREAETWEGPDEPVDVIVLLHVLYYIGKGFLSKCLQWLKPEGIIIVSLIDRTYPLVCASEKIGIHRRIYKCEEFKTELAASQDVRVVNEEAPFETFDLLGRPDYVVSASICHAADDREVKDYYRAWEDLYHSDRVDYNVHMFVLKRK